VDRLREAGAFDVVTCMETLEHCTSPAVEEILVNLKQLVSPEGRVIISVPIETGGAFALKWTIRKLAAMRGLSDYNSYEKYSAGHAFRMMTATRNTALTRPVYGGSHGPYHSHYGFNWRAMREQVSQHLSVERTVYSPVDFAGGWLSSQAWFICRPKRTV
jgi:hypothetical protein